MITVTGVGKATSRCVYGLKVSALKPILKRSELWKLGSRMHGIVGPPTVTSTSIQHTERTEASLAEVSASLQMSLTTDFDTVEDFLVAYTKAHSAYINHLDMHLDHRQCEFCPVLLATFEAIIGRTPDSILDEAFGGAV